MTEIEATLWGAVLGAVIGGTIGFVGAYYSYRWNRSVSLEASRIAELNKAAAEFRAAYTDAIRELIEDSGFAEDVLKKHYTNHANALIRFLPYLGKSERTEIQRCWNKYCWNNEQGYIQNPGMKNAKQMMFAHYTYLQNEDDKVDGRQLALDNLNRLLAFAELR